MQASDQSPYKCPNHQQALEFRCLQHTTPTAMPTAAHFHAGNTWASSSSNQVKKYVYCLPCHSTWTRSVSLSESESNIPPAQEVEACSVGQSSQTWKLWTNKEAVCGGLQDPSAAVNLPAANFDELWQDFHFFSFTENLGE